MGKHPQASTKQNRASSIVVGTLTLTQPKRPSLSTAPTRRPYGAWHLAQRAAPVDVGIGKDILDQISLCIAALKSYIQV